MHFSFMNEEGSGGEMAATSSAMTPTSSSGPGTMTGPSLSPNSAVSSSSTSSSAIVSNAFQPSLMSPSGGLGSPYVPNPAMLAQPYGTDASGFGPIYHHPHHHHHHHHHNPLSSSHHAGYVSSFDKYDKYKMASTTPPHHTSSGGGHPAVMAAATTGYTGHYQGFYGSPTPGHHQLMRQTNSCIDYVQR
ncbi:conserved hypothetical protein [Culex quinquefasciatus]|uniref:Uncharacterized protein n=1 Tax=Culex quinquefasciatus TaxID=7176 RepID=B0WKQ0_CULQU|nr:conserved hypothetical protein [Culex quinquefasciatus]|eukprot:XP_001849284.1 conserved hypothetical protein [Culex quinquefasciatus]